MKMAKATDDDLNAAADLCAALESLTNRWGAMMPEAIAKPEDGSDGDGEGEGFDIEDSEQCRRALEHILAVAERGSLFRVVMGMKVVLDPENKLVDPDLDHIEHHPERVKMEAENAKLKDTLEFVERWANHHGQKDCISAKEALSCIQHYPPILAITRSYADGKVPETRNPYAELAAVTAERDALRNILDEAITTMRHAETFIMTREKMHPSGQQLYRELMDQMVAVRSIDTAKGAA